MGAALDIASKPKSVRRRISRASRAAAGEITRLKSCYQFKNWHMAGAGHRVAVSTKSREGADLISTAYCNPATGTRTVHSLAFDLDFDKADDRWKTGGELDWGQIGNFLAQSEGPIFRAITNVARSSSGRGLGLAVALSPIEIDVSTMRAQISAFSLQSHLIAIFNGYGMGADPAAVGLIRDMPNWLNPDKLVDASDSRRREVDAYRISVVSELLSYTNLHPSIRYIKKSQRDDLLWPHETAEKKLSVLYMTLFDELSMSRSWSFSALRALTGLSKGALYKVLTSPPGWLRVERISKFEGYGLSLVPTGTLTQRAESLLALKMGESASASAPALKLVAPVDLKRPDEVKDGERNAYLTELALTLKHGGIDRDEAFGILQSAVGEIPGGAYSRNCRGCDSILGSIYKNRPSLFGIKGEGSIPGWLLENRQIRLGEIECPKKFKKGISEAYSLAGGSTFEPTEKAAPSILDIGECEGFPLTSFPWANSQASSAVGFVASFLPAVSSLLGSRWFAAPTAHSEALGKLLHFPAPKTTFESSIPCFVTDISGNIHSGFPAASAKIGKKTYATSYEKNRKEFAVRHPIDRFMAAFDRLMGRFGPRAIHERLFQVHCEIVSAGHKDKYQGVAAEYLPPRDPFRRIVMAFLLMSFSMQREILKIVSEG